MIDNCISMSLYAAQLQICLLTRGAYLVALPLGYTPIQPTTRKKTMLAGLYSLDYRSEPFSVNFARKHVLVYVQEIFLAPSSVHKHVANLA